MQQKIIVIYLELSTQQLLLQEYDYRKTFYKIECNAKIEPYITFHKMFDVTPYHDLFHLHYMGVILSFVSVLSKQFQLQSFKAFYLP